MSNEQMLREALQKLLTAIDVAEHGSTAGFAPGYENGHGIECGSLIAEARDEARQALALPTAAPVGEREAFEKWITTELNYGYDLHKDHGGNYTHDATETAWYAWQARAAMAGDADGKRYRWLMKNVVGFECCPPTLLIRLPEDVVFDFNNPRAAIDEAMARGGELE